jgi:hypothetical protein
MPGFAHFFGRNNRHPTRPRGEGEATGRIADVVNDLPRPR